MAEGLDVATSTGRGSERWTARLALLLAVAAAVVLVVSALTHSTPVVLAVVVAVALIVAAAYVFLTHRRLLRWLAAAVLVVVPVALAVMFVTSGMLLPLALVVALAAGALAAGRAALAKVEHTEPVVEREVPPPLRPFLVMNPRSGGGKVVRFGLVERAQALGAEVALLEGPGTVDVTALAEDAVARGVDALGAAGGDGTQALVAAVAAAHDLPFVVVSAGTRNHFALDLGLDREDPAACLDALTADAVELRVDLGVVGDRTFVNNASFGAYAALVQSPAYRGEKTKTTLELLPDLLTGQGGPRLTARIGEVTVEQPQAVLVGNNPYGLGDIAGIGRRARLDTGRLGVVAVRAESAAQAVEMVARRGSREVTSLTTSEVVVDADAETIPVGVDGEAVVLPTPVRCAIRPGALRVRVPRHRPGLAERRPTWSWQRIWRLATGGSGRMAP